MFISEDLHTNESRSIIKVVSSKRHSYNVRKSVTFIPLVELRRI